MSDGSAVVAPSAASCRRGASAVSRRCCGGGGCGLGRLVRRLRRQGKQALCAARPAATALRGCQYDPLSYARNFDQSGGFGGDDSDAARLYYSYTFSSRFVLPPAASSASTVAAAPNGLAITSRATAASH